MPPPTTTIFSLHPRQDAPPSADNPWEGFELWHYSPSIAGSIIFALLFILITSHHIFLLIRNKTYFCIPFVVGGLLEIIGYIARAAAHNNQDSVALYSMQSLCLLLAPILFAASVYMILGRVVRLVGGEHHTIIRVDWLTKIFVGGDVFCFMIQSAGGGLMSTADTQESLDMSSNIILGGLVLQILIFCVFVVTAVVFQVRMRKQPTTASVEGPLGTARKGGASAGGLKSKFAFMPNLSWKNLLLGLYVVSVLITVRNVFRVVEFGQGWMGYLLTREWPLYVFDALLMVLVLVVCVVWYNPEISRGKKSKKTTKRDDAIGMMDVESGAAGRQEGKVVRPWS